MKTKQKQGSKPAGVVMAATNGKYSIGDRAVLVDLTIHRWTPTTVDKRASNEVAQKHGSDIDMGRYEKDLLDRKALADINSATNELRKMHNYLTCPWTDGGVRILSSAGYFGYNTKIMQLKAEFEKHAQFLADNFEDKIKAAQKRLGTLFDRAEYPTKEKLKACYGVDIRVLPVPDSSQYTGALATFLGDEIVQVRKSTEDLTKQAVEAAMKDVYQRLAEVVTTAAEKLKGYSKSDDGTTEGKGFKSSLISNITDLLDIIPTLNITGDPQLSIFADRIRKEIASADVDSLKHDNTLRKDVVKAADDILAKMSSYFG